MPDLPVASAAATSSAYAAPVVTPTGKSLSRTNGARRNIMTGRRNPEMNPRRSHHQLLERQRVLDERDICSWLPIDSWPDLL